MSNSREPSFPILGFLLLRDGHAVPLSGISPDELKSGAKHLIPKPDEEPLRHRRCLNAIVDCLGFNGDFGTFKNEGWPEFEAFLREKRCTHRAGFFPSDHGGCGDLYFRKWFGPTRRQLSDRIFESDTQILGPVFLGYGVDWEPWERGTGHYPTQEIVAALGGDSATAEQRARTLFNLRFQLMAEWGFIDDKLVWGPANHIVDKTYWEIGSSQSDRLANHTKVAEAVRAFRDVFDPHPHGWADILQYNDRLVVLRATDGAWDILWRAYRDEEPPTSSDVSRWSNLAIEDLPTSLMAGNDLRRVLYFRQDCWDEFEAHQAEQAFYDRGGTRLSRRLTTDEEVRASWLRDQNLLPSHKLLRAEDNLPPGFRVVEVQDRRLAVSELVDLGSFRNMLNETKYLDRRSDNNEPWERANDGEPDSAPVGVNWNDAQAYCAYFERQVGLQVRLPNQAELRAIHPFFSERYEALSGADFLWESFPPRPLESSSEDTSQRKDVPSAVAWSEPRFLEPGPDLAEFPPPSGIGGTSRKRWIADFPPQAAWCDDLPWATYAGLKFIDAWDAYEWCQEPSWIHGRFWEGSIGRESWGAYKNVKVTFRLVIELEG